jgi:hypothetical protein
MPDGPAQGNRTMTDTDLHGYTELELRRALERLREGLYDALAVRLLTAHRTDLDARLQQHWQRLEAGETVHLCISGAYGQGKSHTLAYLKAQALEQGYVVSAMNLDPREVPMHLLRRVTSPWPWRIQAPTWQGCSPRPCRMSSRRFWSP